MTEANLGGVRFRSGDQVFRAIEISPPDIILILRSGSQSRDQRSEENNNMALLQPIRMAKIAFDGRVPGGKGLARPYKRTAVPAGVDEAPAKATSPPVPLPTSN